MADTSNLTKFLGDVATSIRLKKGTTEPIQPKNFDTEISTIDTSGLNTYDATATENDIVADKTAYVNGEKVTGVIIDDRGTIDEPKTVTLGDKTVTYTNSDNGYGGYMRIEMTPDKASVIDNTSKITTDVLGKVIADNIGLTPDILASGTTLLGVEGTHASSTEKLVAYLMESEYQGGDSVAYVLGALRANKLDYTRDKISNITFSNDISVVSDTIDSWDVSFSEDGTITAYICADSDNVNLFKMFIISDDLKFTLPSDSSYYFAGYTVCEKIIGLELLDTSNVTSMLQMFRYCENVKVLDTHTFITSNVTTMKGMFYFCKNATIINVTGFDTSKVTNMAWMFGSCDEISSVDASSFDTRNVTDMSYMFYGYKYALAVNLRNADFTNVTVFTDIFTPWNRLNELPYMHVYVKDRKAYDWVTTNGGRTANVYII